MIIKFCKKCKTDTERNNYGGCKPCKSAAGAAYRAANAEKERARKAKWYANQPKKIKNEIERKKANACQAVYQLNNAEKIRAANKEYRESNREKINERKARWYAANPEARRIHESNRRARKRAADGKLSKGLSEKLFNLQRGKCACGCNQPLGNDYHIDHIMPIALGGSNTDENIQLLRAKCNMQKSAKHPVEFMQSRGFLL